MSTPFSPEEMARIAANGAALADAHAARESEIDMWLERLSNAEAVLMPLTVAGKRPVESAWQQTAATDWDAIEEHIRRGGNIGAHLGASRWVAWDGDNAAATAAMLAAGFDLFTISAGSRNPAHAHAGGAHRLWRLPGWVPLVRLTGPTKAVVLDGGASIDVLAGNHQIVVPPSVVVIKEPVHYVGTYATASEAGYCEADRDGWLRVADSDDGVLPELPLWALSDELLAYAPEGTVVGEPPAGWEPMIGTIAVWREAEARVREPGEGDDELTAAVDRLDLLSMLEAAGIAGERAGFDSCGPCETWLREGSDAEKSITVHNCGVHGARVQVWTTAFAGLPQGGYSRLDALCGLTGRERGAVMRELGLVQEKGFTGFDADDLEELAAEAEAAAQAGGRRENVPTVGTRLPDGTGVGKVVEVEVGASGLLQRAQRLRTAAAGMRVKQRAVTTQAGAVLIGAGSVVGAPTDGSAALALAKEPAPEDTPEPEQSVATAPAITGLPPVDPSMPAYLARAKEEMYSTPAPIDTNAGRAHGLLPVDTRSLADAVAGPRATASPVDVEATDGQLAQAVAAAVAGKLRYAFDAETWYAWDGDRFAVDAEAARGAVQGLLQRQGQATDPAERQRMIRAWAWKKLTAEQKLRAAKEWEGFAIDMDTGDLLGPDGVRIEQVAAEVPAKAEETRTRNAVVAQLGSDRGIKTRTAQLDAHPEVVACEGGYMHLATPAEVAAGAAPVTVTTPDPVKLATKLMGARYDAGARCPRWVKLLEDALPNREVRRWLQKALGQALFGRQDEHLLLVLEGQGGNGKGAVMEVITAVFGEYAAVLQASVLTLAGMGNHATDQMPLRGARLATADEIPPQQLNLDLVKKLTGGGPHSARLCGQNSTTWELSHTMCLTTNNRLQWPPSAMAAVRRRLAVIRFEVAFGEAGFPPIVKGLAASIISEESSGVLNWLADGYRMYTEEGLETYQDLPPAILEWTQATLAQSSSWAGFCDVAFEVTKDPSDVLLSGDVFKLWDFYRSEDTDQKHASPGSVRVVAAMVVDQLRGVTRIEARGKVKAGVRGVRWSEDGLALLEEMNSAKFATPAFGPSVTPVVPPGM